MSLTEAELLEDVRRRLFSPTRSPHPRAIGLELELIPIHERTRARALATDDGRMSTATVLSELGQREGWVEQSGDGDPPSWTTRDGTRISFEPGGQIEISTAPQPTASEVIHSTQSLVALMHEAMSDSDILLIARGVDPFNDLAAVPLQLHRDRYTGMTRYFDSIGPTGVQMMRQTAALQINLERGEDPKFRWRLLNDLAPVVVALFANSRDYADTTTEHVSYRAHLWRTLDPSRTGIIYDDYSYVERYLEFALDAVAMRSAGPGGRYRTFREWMSEPTVGLDDWLFHLSTLFPEVRPKEYFELRSADTIRPELLAAPVVFVAGLVYDEESAVIATEIIGLPEPGLLERAGRYGLADPKLWSLSAALSDFALEGALRLGQNYISQRHWEEARKYLRRVCRRD